MNPLLNKRSTQSIKLHPALHYCKPVEVYLYELRAVDHRFAPGHGEGVVERVRPQVRVDQGREHACIVNRYSYNFDIILIPL